MGDAVRDARRIRLAHESESATAAYRAALEAHRTGYMILLRTSKQHEKCLAALRAHDNGDDDV